MLESVRRRLLELDTADRPHADLAERIDTWRRGLKHNGYEDAAVAATMGELANRRFTLGGPVPASVADLVQQMRFPIAPRGRDRTQVDTFMTEVAHELRRRAAPHAT